MDIVMKVLKQSELKNWNLETRLVDLGFDSLDTIDFIVQVEEQLAFNLSEEEQGKEYTTLKDLLDAFDRSQIAEK